MGNPAHYVELAPQWKPDGSPQLNFTADPEANQLLADDPNAFLIGIVLDQQIPTTKAFAGPHVLKQRLGHFDVAKIAAMDQEQFIEVFREKPAVHRFPASMGKRVHDACAALVADWDGDAAAIWTDQPDAKAVMKRLGGIPGVGAAKQKLAVMLLGRYFGADIPGWREAAPVSLPD